MEITIIETAAKVELNIIDPQSGCNWTRDLLGNHGALPDNESGTYYMPQETYAWWASLITKYQEADDRAHATLSELHGDDYDNMAEELRGINCDLEDLPATINSIRNQYEGKNNPI